MLERAEPLEVIGLIMSRIRSTRSFEGLSSGLAWKDSALGGRGGYEPTYRESPTFETTRPLGTRLSTQNTLQPGAEVTPQLADARSLEEKLRYAAREG